MLLTHKREARGWSKAELARRAGLNQNTVYGIENGRLVPYESQLRKLAVALGVPEDRAGELMYDAAEAAEEAIAH